MENQPQKERFGIEFLGLYLLWPFLALLAAIRYNQLPFSKLIFILFCFYFGVTFIVPENRTGAADSARYARELIKMHQSPVTFDNFQKALYTKETNLVDIYQPLITWMLSLFTDNVHLLFGIFALVFGLFYAGSLWIILNQLKGNITFLIFVFLLTFMLINPIWNINGVRMWTAAQICIYGLLVYFVEEKKHGLWWSLSSVFVHFSFLFPVALLLVFLVLPKRTPVFFIFFLVTLFITEIDLIKIKDNLSFLPDIFQPRVKSYTNTEYAEIISKNLLKNSWHVKFASLALKWSSIAFLSLIFFGLYRKIREINYLNAFFCLTLFMFGASQLASNIPSGGRFMVLAYSLTFVLLILLFTKFIDLLWLKRIGILSIPFLLFYCVFSIRMGLDYMGIMTFAGNLFTTFFIDNAKPLIEFIKSVF